MITVAPKVNQAKPSLKLDLNNLTDEQKALEIKDLDLYYGDKQALSKVNMNIPKGQVTAFIGPSGCGKSTLLRCINRMNDLVDICRIEGEIMLHGQNIYDKSVDVAALRRNVGMVFQRPNPFPKSIYENVVYGLRLQGIKEKRKLDEVVEQSLRGAAPWDEVKDRLNDSGLSVSGGQQQRICIARALAVNPEIVLMDEPASALDPISTQAIEQLIKELSSEVTIIIVTHNMQQATRISDYAAVMMAGEERVGRMIEYGTNDQVFGNPKDERTEAYVTGRIG